jgi:predicted nucleic acid-binding Zn finger protein
MSDLSEDFCVCEHVASVHKDGEGQCETCRATRQTTWIAVNRCYNFRWAAKWETE